MVLALRGRDSSDTFVKSVPESYSNHEGRCLNVIFRKASLPRRRDRPQGEYMLSDTLFEAVQGICDQLTNPPDFYQGEVRERAEKLLEEIDALRVSLDCPPPNPLPPRRSAKQILLV